MATLKLKEHGSSHWTEDSTQSTLWLTAPANVTLNQPSHASRSNPTFSWNYYTEGHWRSIVTWHLCFVSTGLSYILKRIKSVGQQEQTLKQRPSCAEAAQLYMKKMASPFICHNELYREPEISLIYYSVLFSLLSMLTHTEISEHKYCSRGSLKDTF